MKNNKLIIFDCDGTLVESEIIATEVFTKYWATHGVHFTKDEFKELFIGTGSDAPIVVETNAKLPSYAPEEGDRLLDEAIKRDLTYVSGINFVLDKLDDFNICVASNSSMNYVKTALLKTRLNDYFKENIAGDGGIEGQPAAVVVADLPECFMELEA